MADDADRAEEVVSRELDAILGSRRVHQPPVVDTGERHCLDCGDCIPPARVFALPLVKRCVDCQELREVADARL